LQTGVNDAPIALNPYGAANLSPVPGSGVPFRMYTTKSSTDVDGTVRLVIVDPDAVVTDVEFRSNPWGIGGATTGYADMPIVGTDSGTFSTTYETTVARGSYGYVAIELRVTYLDGFGVPQTATGSFEFVPVGYDRSLLAREVAGILGFAAFGIPSQEGARVYTVSTLTGNVTLNFYIGGNQKFILVIDATGGPYTITLGTLSGPNLRESDGAPVVSLVVNGFTFFRLRYSLAAHATYWDV
jgi:hypothetical protein